MRTNICPKCTYLEAAQHKFLLGGGKGENLDFKVTSGGKIQLNPSI